MAESENIGAISVDIVGDYSQLQSDIDSAAQVAQEGGQQIAESMNAGAAGADQLAGAATNATEALTQLGGAVAGAAEVGPALESAAGGAQTLDEQLQALYGQGLTVAEALAQIQGEAESMSGGLEGAGSAAATAAEQLSLFNDAASAPYSDAAGQLNLFATELEPIGGEAATAAGAVEGLGTALEPLSAEAAGAATGMGEFGAAEVEVQGETATVAGSLEELGHQFLALAEAFVITEGLREFGQEALTASDSITRASISLTALTGSAGTAEETIKGLEALGIQDGLAMPSLLTAATRMQNMLGPSADVVKLLGQVANSAAVMNTGIDQSASAFDRMATSGMANARQLATMGLSLDTLSKAMNSVSGESDATAGNVAKMFKAMDQTDRVAVLSAALDNLAGIAQKTAEETFGGQWQTLANQWEKVMVDVGGALMPVISGLTNLIAVDIVPWVQSAAETFRTLPGPLQDVVVAIGVLGAALPPLFLAMGAFGLALNGVNEVIPVLTGLMSALGLSTDAVAAEDVLAAAAAADLAAADTAASAAADALATSQGTAGAAVSGAAGEAAIGAEAVGGLAGAEGAATVASEGMGAALAGIAGVIGGAFVLALTGAVLGFVQLNQSLSEFHRQQAQMDADFTKWLANLGSNATTQDQVQGAIDKVNAALANQLITVQQAVPLIDKYTTQLKALAGVQVKQMLDGMGVSITLVSSSMTVADAAAAGYAAHMQDLQGAVNTAQAAMVKAVSAWKDGTGSVQDADKATQNYNAAVKALTGSQSAQLPVVKSVTDSMTQLATATHAYVDLEAYLPSAAQQAANAAAAENISITALSNTIDHAKESLAFWLTQDLQNISVQQQVIFWNNAVNTATGALATATDQSAQSQKAAYSEIGAITKSVLSPLPATFKELAMDLSAVGAGAVAMAPPLDTAAEILAAMGVTIDGTSNKITSQIQAYQALANVADNTTQTEDAAWSKISGDLNKISQNDLPLVISLYQQHLSDLVKTGDAESKILQAENVLYPMEIKRVTAQGDFAKAAQLSVQYLQAQYDASVKMNQPIGDQLALLQKVYQQQVTNAENAGENASGLVVQLGHVGMVIDALKTKSEGWGAVQIGVEKDIINGLESMGQPIAQVIVEGGNMADAFVKIGKQIAETCITTIINGGIKLVISSLIVDLIPSIAKTGGSFVSMGSTIASMFGGVSKAAVDMGASVGNTAVDLGSTVDQVVGGVTKTATSSAAATSSACIAANAAVMASTMTTIGAISSMVGAIAGIIGDIEMTRMIHLLGEIEVSTRETDAKMTDVTSVLYKLMDQGNTVWGYALPDLDQINTAVQDLHGDMVNTQNVLNSGFGAVVAALQSSGGVGMPLQGGPAMGAPVPAGTIPGYAKPAAVGQSVSNSSSQSSVVNSGGNTTNNFNLSINGGDPQATSSAMMKMLQQMVPSFNKASS